MSKAIDGITFAIAFGKWGGLQFNRDTWIKRVVIGWIGLYIIPRDFEFWAIDIVNAIEKSKEKN